MTDASGPATQPIAGVLADVDGTLVTKNKALTPRAIEAIEELHERGVIFAITSGRPPRGMQMLVHPLEMRGPMAAFNGGVIVLPDMTVVDERPIPADAAPEVIDTIVAHGLYPWIYSGADWYVTDPGAPHAARESSTVQFQPTVVPSYHGLLDRLVKIVGVSDFGGLRHSDGTVGFAPRLPQALSRLAFTILIRGRRLRVEVTHSDVTYSLADGEPLEIVHYGEEVQLSADKPEVRPIQEPAPRPRPGQPPGREPARRRSAEDGG